MIKIPIMYFIAVFKHCRKHCVAKEAEVRSNSFHSMGKTFMHVHRAPSPVDSNVGNVAGPLFVALLRGPYNKSKYFIFNLTLQYFLLNVITKNFFTGLNKKVREKAITTSVSVYLENYLNLVRDLHHYICGLMLSQCIPKD
uniref:Uncharacterized protein n=1 Tax=Glossina brevipalpis TaxID=37001 RepID=A0A1A9W6Q5_9MUSC